MKPWIDTFNERYIPEPMSGCWLWIGAAWSLGYGHMCRKIDGKSINKAAHRFSWEYHVGPIPERMQVLHKCDVPSCVNPDHLFIGTQQDNVDDMTRKGRQVKLKGEESGMAKLTDARVLYIRKSKKTRRELSAELGVSLSTITQVINFRVWAHVK